MELGHCARPAFEQEPEIFDCRVRELVVPAGYIAVAVVVAGQEREHLGGKRSRRRCRETWWFHERDHDRRELLVPHAHRDPRLATRHPPEVIRLEAELEAALGRAVVTEALGHVDAEAAEIRATHGLAVDEDHDVGCRVRIECPSEYAVAIELIDGVAQHRRHATNGARLVGRGSADRARRSSRANRYRRTMRRLFGAAGRDRAPAVSGVADAAGSSESDARPALQMRDEELDALLPRAASGHATIDFRDQFEGLWTDRADVETVLARRRRAGQVSDADVAQLEHWIERGYVIFEGAVPVEVCEEIKADLGAAFEHGDERLRLLAPGEHFGRQLEAATDMKGMRVNDIYVYFESARRALFSAPIVHFLSLIFDGAPMLLQSLTFDSGSRQGYHRDTAYVVVDPPLALAASWIALEDVQPGSGELTYYEGSHHLSGLLFNGEYKCWHAERDGIEEHDRFMNELVARSESAGLARRTLLAHEGDVLIWSADLAHGGAPVLDESSTRKSLVGHYCPEWAVPRYFDQFPDHAARRAYGGGYFASTHYAIDPGS